MNAREATILLALVMVLGAGYYAFGRRGHTVDDVVGSEPRAERLADRRREPAPVSPPEDVEAAEPGVDPETARLDALAQQLDTERYQIADSVSAESLQALFAHVKARAHAGDPVWLGRLADMYLYSLGTTDDLWKETIKRAAEAGHARSQYDHAQVLQNDPKLPRAPMNRKPKPGATGAQHQPLPYDTIMWMERAIAGGDVDAMLWLGGWYVADGRFEKGVPLIERAERLQTGEGCAKYLLGTLYIEGNGVPRDLERGLTLYEKSRGCANVGGDALDILTQGKLTPPDYARAVRILEAEDWLPNRVKAARLYETGGPGLVKDVEKARAIYREAKAADFGVDADLKRIESK